MGMLQKEVQNTGIVFWAHKEWVPKMAQVLNGNKHGGFT